MPTGTRKNIMCPGEEFSAEGKRMRMEYSDGKSFFRHASLSPTKPARRCSDVGLKVFGDEVVRIHYERE